MILGLPYATVVARQQIYAYRYIYYFFLIKKETTLEGLTISYMFA